MGYGTGFDLILQVSSDRIPTEVQSNQCLGREEDNLETEDEVIRGSPYYFILSNESVISVCDNQKMYAEATNDERESPRYFALEEKEDDLKITPLFRIRISAATRVQWTLCLSDRSNVASVWRNKETNILMIGRRE